MKKEQQEQQQESEQQHQQQDDQIKQQEQQKQPSNLHDYTEMLREATERIANDFVHLLNVLKMGERFHNIPLDQESKLYNVFAMWSRCFGYKMPAEFLGNHPLHKVDGASLLSQYNDFFASDWFSEIVDNIVKNAGFERIGNEQTPKNMPREARQMTPPPFNPLIFMDTTPTSIQ
ncbi:Uncharacterized protein RDABS01_029686 [Bienertia sinuspersici]